MCTIIYPLRGYSFKGYRTYTCRFRHQDDIRRIQLSDWQKFFDCYADKYDKECFVQNTDAELPFLQDQLRLSAEGQILDIGCGTGRHSVWTG